MALAGYPDSGHNAILALTLIAKVEEEEAGILDVMVKEAGAMVITKEAGVDSAGRSGRWGPLVKGRNKMFKQVGAGGHGGGTSKAPGATA